MGTPQFPKHILPLLRQVVPCNDCWNLAWSYSKTREAVRVRDFTTYALSLHFLTAAEVAAILGTDKRRVFFSLARMRSDISQGDKKLASMKLAADQWTQKNEDGTGKKSPAAA